MSVGPNACVLRHKIKKFLSHHPPLAVNLLICWEENTQSKELRRNLERGAFATFVPWLKVREVGARAPKEPPPMTDVVKRERYVL